MSMGWWPFGDSNPGEELLRAYFYEAANFPSFPYQDFDTWLAHLNSKVPDFSNFIGELVEMNSASTTVEDAKDRLITLANMSEGSASIPDITKTAGGSGDTINWGAGIPEIAIDTVSDVAVVASQVAENVGTGVLGSLNMIKYLPWILGGAGVIYVMTMAKGHSKLLGARKNE